MDLVKAISWRKRRVKQLEDWTEAICRGETLDAFTDVVSGVMYSFPDPSEILHSLLRLGIVQYKRYFDLNVDETRLGVFVSPNLGHRAVYYMYKCQHEEFVTPENPLTYFRAIVKVEEGLDLYDYELQVRMEYEVLAKEYGTSISKFVIEHVWSSI